MNNLFLTVLKHDLKLALRTPREIINPVLFFLVIVSLFPLAITPDTLFLKQIAGGVIWVAALLATLLALDRLFRSDFVDGTLEQMIVSPCPLPLIMSAKILAHWLQTGLPLLLIAPLLAGMLQLPLQAIMALELSLLIGTPILSLLGSAVLALTVGLGQGGMLLSLLLLPLYVPVLVFGAGAVVMVLHGLPIRADLLFLSAYLVLAATLMPFVTAAALRVGAGL